MSEQEASVQPANVHGQLTIFECDHPHRYALIAGDAPKRRARKIRNVFESYLAGSAPPQFRGFLQPTSPSAGSQGAKTIAATQTSSREGVVDISHLRGQEVEL